MKLKRTIGIGKIFLYSCCWVLAFAGVIWLIINGVYAAYISGEEPRWLWIGSFTHESADTLTPWLLMAAAMVIYYRYCKMCSGNNVSCTKRTVVFSLISVFVPTAFAAADLLTAKLVLERLYGGIIMTRFEKGNTYFLGLIYDYMYSLQEDVTEISSPYTMKVMLLLLAVMTLYYYCFFLAGCYIMQCFRCGSKKTLIYYAVTSAVFVFFLWLFLNDYPGFIGIISIIPMIAVFFTNPAVFLFLLTNIITVGDMDEIKTGFVMMTVFILIMIPSITFIELRQFPNKSQIKKTLNKYREKTSEEREEKINDGQT